MDHINQNPDKKELRKFGLIFAVFFLLFFGLLIPWIWDKSTPNWVWYVSGTFAAVALVLPVALGPVYRIWMKIGHVLGWINTRIILGLVFAGGLAIGCERSAPKAQASKSPSTSGQSEDAAPVSTTTESTDPHAGHNHPPAATAEKTPAEGLVLSGLVMKPDSDWIVEPVEPGPMKPQAVYSLPSGSIPMLCHDAICCDLSVRKTTPPVPSSICRTESTAEIQPPGVTAAS